MKKFLNKLENKLDGKSSSSSTSSPNRPQQHLQQQQYAPPSAPPRPQQYPSYQQQQQPHYVTYGQATTVPQGTFEPPARVPPGQQAGGYTGAPPTQAAGREDPFAALRRYDTVFIVDDSESMEMHWDTTRDALVGVVQKAVQYDSDGCDIYFFNSQVVVENLRTAQDVRSIFNRVDPRKSTPTARALARVLEPYLSRLEAAHRAKQTGGQVEVIKPLNIVILTDGAPDRDQSPEGVIVDAGRRLDAIRAPPYQLGFSFVQIADDDEAQQALQYLDDHLKTEYGIRDMVDTTLFPSQGGHIDTEYLLKGLLGGINRKYDKQ